jgi:hypothetical protein
MNKKIPRGGVRVVQPGMQFPNLYQCNKVLVNQFFFNQAQPPLQAATEERAVKCLSKAI